MQPSEEIKAKLDISEVIGEYIKLVPAGLNHKAICPFHQDKSPSLMISHDKQIWRCFGCTKGGDIFTFVMEMEGVTFVEALRLLAPKAGVTLQKIDHKKESEKTRILDILNISARYYAKVLSSSSLAENANKYLIKRGLTEDMIKEWGIGYSPDSWDDLLQFLKKKGYTDDDIVKSGMAIKKEKGYGYYNRFRGRIMFPISDVNANVVGFTARVSPEKEATEKMGKYINSPATNVYDKSSIIFGLNKAKLNIKKQDLIVVVEGQMDVITAHTRGFNNVIASSGTALTEDQVKILKRYSSNITLAFDADQAGLMAAERAIDESFKQDMNVSVINITSGKDPDDCIRNNPDDWVAAVEKRLPAMEHYFNQYLKDLNLSDIGDKRLAVKRLLPKVRIISDSIEKDFWLQKISSVIDVREGLLREALQKVNNPSRSPIKQAQLVEQSPQKISITEEDKLYQLIISLLLKFPYLIELALNKLPSDWIIGKISNKLYITILIYYNENSNSILDSRAFYSNFRKYTESTGSQDQVNVLDYLAMEAENSYSNFDETSAKDEVLGIIIAIKRKYLENLMKSMEKKIMDAERANNQDLIKDLMKEFYKLSQELSN